MFGIVGYRHVYEFLSVFGNIRMNPAMVRIPDFVLASIAYGFRVLRVDRYAIAITFISLLATGYYQWAETFWWGGSDHLAHLSIARWFLGQPHGEDVPWTGPGMAIYLILSGVPLFDTWRGLILGFAIFGFLIPIFVYYSLSWVSRPLAFFAALLMILSAEPYIYSKTGFSEQLFHFLHYLALLATSRYLRSGSPPLLAVLTATLFALCFVRPVAALYFWIFFFVAVLATLVLRRPMKPLLLAALLYAIGMAGWALSSRSSGNAFFSPLLKMESVSQKRFAEAYFAGPVHGFVEGRNSLSIDPFHDASSMRLYVVLVEHIKRHSRMWQVAPSLTRPAPLFGNPSRNPEALAITMLSTPTFMYFDVIREAVHEQLGRPAGERLLRSIAKEYGTTGLMGAVRYLAKNPIRFLVGGVPPGGNRNFFGLFLLTRFRYDTGRFYSFVFDTTSITKDEERLYWFNPTPERVRAMVDRDRLGAVTIVDPKNGPASREIIEGMRQFLSSYPTYWEESNPWLALHKGNPDSMLTAIFRTPVPGESGIYEGFLYDSLVRFFGFARADRLFNQAAWETIRAYPFALGIIWDNVLRATIIRTFGDLKSQLDALPFKHWGDVIYITRRTDYQSLTPGLSSELPSEIGNTPHVTLFGRAYAIAHLVSFVFVISALLFLLPALSSPAWPFALFLTLAYLYHVAVIAVYGNFGASRYYDVFIFLPVMITLIGCSQLRRMFLMSSK
jgi:hypothetical protein